MACRRPGLRIPLAIANLEELRPGSRRRSEVRILFVFDPWRSAILLVAGDKAGSWNKWYARMIPVPSSSARST
ncbi:MAG: type II toxin-antitoxin system RelE/ParE family toxin [Trebonia sp.]|uniref:type II toxin-antitoxin system RelE/ParE family toxin n=1 Tax=Trebonia sp. TaxID=2767075 RepID=UPI003BB0ACE1